VAYVVTEACVRCKYTDCVAACPVDCFHEGENMLVIDPAECIDCNACVPACPVNAIYALDEVPDDQHAFIALNARLAAKWPVISRQKAAHPDAETMKGVTGKLSMVSEKAGG
jgi:ferredoxin